MTQNSDNFDSVVCMQPGTKVIVMDNDGSQSKEIARALRRFGVRVMIKVAQIFLGFYWVYAALQNFIHVAS